MSGRASSSSSSTPRKRVKREEVPCPPAAPHKKAKRVVRAAANAPNVADGSGSAAIRVKVEETAHVSVTCSTGAGGSRRRTAKVKTKAAAADTHGLQAVGVVAPRPKQKRGAGPSSCSQIGCKSHAHYKEQPQVSQMPRQVHKSLTAVEARAIASQTSPCSVTRVAGVSFEGRQERLASVCPGDAVMLVKDPHNPYDPHAVSVRTLDGRDLGFVPRDDTGAVTQPITFGRVEGIGPQKDTGLLGFHVSAQPSLPTLAVDVIPLSIIKYTRLHKMLPADDWHRLRDKALRKGNHRCKITGGSEGRIVAAAVWHVDEVTKVVTLTGMAALASEVKAAKSLLKLPDQDSEKAATATETLCQINGWSADELLTYVRHLTRRLRKRSGNGWVLDVGWLERQGVAVPAALAAVSA